MTESSSPAPPGEAGIAFTPVPLRRARHDGWSVERQRGFIEALHATGVVGIAAQSVGMTARSAYRLRNRPDAASFAAAWDCALAEARDRALDVAMDRICHPETVPRFYRGQFTGSLSRALDERLLIAALLASGVAHRRAHFDPRHGPKVKDLPES